MFTRLSKRLLFGTTAAATLYVGWRTWQWYLENDKRLTAERYVALPVVEKERLTHDAFRLRLATEPQPSKRFPVLSCLYVKDDMIQVMRPYTPINDPFRDGHIDLIVKEYPQGSISRMLGRINVQDMVFMRGPMMEYDYHPNTVDEIGMVCLLCFFSLLYTNQYSRSLFVRLREVQV